MLEQRAGCESQVLRQLVERPPRPERARVFAHPRLVAQIAPRRPSRFVFRQAGRAPLALFLFEMELQLLAELGFLAVGAATTR